MTQKLYCYADETGHHNKDELFIVGVVIVGDDRDDIEKILELVERDTGKGAVKWRDADHKKRLAYMRRVCDFRLFKDKLYFIAYDKVDAPVIQMVARGLAQAWHAHATGEVIAVAFIDGLPDSKVRDVIRQLRDSDVPTEKVRGVKKDESSALIRLADAICGFVRGASIGQPELTHLLERTIARGAIVDVGRNKKTHVDE
jgi:hypothetical protein